MLTRLVVSSCLCSSLLVDPNLFVPCPSQSKFVFIDDAVICILHHETSLYFWNPHALKFLGVSVAYFEDDSCVASNRKL